MEREWYDDGFTMEEQAELRRNSVQIKLKLTEKFQAESADKLIKSLQEKLWTNESYIDELEYNNKKLTQQVYELTEQVDKWKRHFKQISDKYSVDMKELIKDPIISKFKEEISALEKEISKLKTDRDHLLYQLSRK